MLHRDEILHQALSLSPEDRAFVVSELEHSLEQDRPSSEAFLAALRRRSAAYRSGATMARPVDEVLADLRRKYSDKGHDA
ncbi:MAG TPA: addiction module protein [Pirellulales bacterium]|nr:addiction module protein [Pirellulales bacterium]